MTADPTDVELAEGAKQLFDLAQLTSESDAAMGIAQLLLAAAALAAAAKLSHKSFLDGVKAAWRQVEAP